MLIEIYILLSIVSFFLLILAIFSPSFLPDDAVANLYLLPIAFIIFGSLFFASFDLRTSTTITSAQNLSILNASSSRTVYEYTTTTTYFKEIAFAWMYFALALVCIILFLWELFRIL
jgi:hypothetical protein